MKALAVTLALVLSSLVSAHAATITNVEVDSYFQLPDGSIARISVSRFTNPETQQVFTQLFYSTCVTYIKSNCQIGNGLIPNSAVTGFLPKGEIK